MPVTIACPKCQTKYKLPESALGKPLKCKKCGAAFRTQAAGATGSPKPTASQRKPTAPTKPQPSKQELEKLGIDGPLKRQADVFAGTAPPPPQKGNPLGNFVVEDPGFADLNTAKQEVANESGGEDGMAAILGNPYANAKSGITRRKNDPNADFAPYAFARVGMWIVYVSWIVLLVCWAGLYLFTWVRRLAPGMVTSVVETIGPGVFAGLVFTVLGVSLLALLMVFLGQIFCIFSPNKDEKIYASIAVGSMVGAFIFPIVGIFMGVFTAEATGAGQTTRAMMGLMFLVLIILSYGLVLSNMFFFITYFRRVGKNLKAKVVVESAQVALLTWIAAIVVGIIGAVALVVMVAIAGPKGGTRQVPDWFNIAVDIIAVINFLLSCAVIAMLIAMVRSALQKTKAS